MKLFYSYLIGLIFAVSTSVYLGASLTATTATQAVIIMVLALPYTAIIYLWFFSVDFKPKLILLSGLLSLLLISFLAYLTLLQTNNMLNVPGAVIIWLLFAGGIYNKLLNRQAKNTKTA